MRTTLGRCLLGMQVQNLLGEVRHREGKVRRGEPGVGLGAAVDHVEAGEGEHVAKSHGVRNGSVWEGVHALRRAHAHLRAKVGARDAQAEERREGQCHAAKHQGRRHGVRARSVLAEDVQELRRGNDLQCARAGSVWAGPGASVALGRRVA